MPEETTSKKDENTKDTTTPPVDKKETTTSDDKKKSDEKKPDVPMKKVGDFEIPEIVYTQLTSQKFEEGQRKKEKELREAGMILDEKTKKQLDTANSFLSVMGKHFQLDPTKEMSKEEIQKILEKRDLIIVSELQKAKDDAEKKVIEESQKATNAELKYKDRYIDLEIERLMAAKRTPDGKSIYDMAAIGKIIRDIKSMSKLGIKEGSEQVYAITDEGEIVINKKGEQKTLIDVITEYDASDQSKYFKLANIGGAGTTTPGTSNRSDFINQVKSKLSKPSLEITSLGAQSFQRSKAG